MKKKITAVLLAAALAMSFSACGSADKDKDKTDSLTGEYTNDESKSIKEAKKVLSEWYEHMNKSEIKEAVKLMTPEYAKATGFDTMEEGTELTTVEYEISDDAMLSSSDTGELVVVFPVKITAPTEQELFVNVTCYATGALISGDSGTAIEPEGSSQNADGSSTRLDMSYLADQLAAASFEAANAKAAELAEGGKAPKDGVFNSAKNSDNELVKEASKAIDPDSFNVTAVFNITVEGGAVTKIEMIVGDGRSTVTSIYPAPTAQ